jgi:hypothetical protein
VGREAGALGVGEVLGDRTAQLAVLLDQDVGQTSRTALLGELLPGVEGLAGLARAARHDDGPDVVGLEDPERRVSEVCRALHQLLPEPGVRLVGPEPGHRFGVGEPRQRGRDVDADELPQRDGDLLTESEDVVLLDEAHLDVELGELRLPVSPEVLVPVAPGNLVVALHPSDHEQLLEQLGALREGVPRARGKSRGHDEVPGALRR